MITIPISLLIALPLVGVALAIGAIEGYAQITLLKVNHKIRYAEKQVEKCQKDLDEISKNYYEKQGEMKAALEAYEELASLMGTKK